MIEKLYLSQSMLEDLVREYAIKEFDKIAEQRRMSKKAAKKLRKQIETSAVSFYTRKNREVYANVTVVIT